VSRARPTNGWAIRQARQHCGPVPQAETLRQRGAKLPIRKRHRNWGAQRSCHATTGHRARRWLSKRRWRPEQLSLGWAKAPALVGLSRGSHCYRSAMEALSQTVKFERTSRLDPVERTSEASQTERFFNAVNQDEENALRDTHSLGCILVTSSHRVWLCFPFLHAYLAVVGPYRSVLRIGLYGPVSADHPPWRCI